MERPNTPWAGFQIAWETSAECARTVSRLIMGADLDVSIPILPSATERDSHSGQFFENRAAPLRMRRKRKVEYGDRSEARQKSVVTSLDRKVWLTGREAADYLGTTTGGLRNRVYRGQLKPHKPFGYLGRCYYKRTDLDRLIEGS